MEMKAPTTTTQPQPPSGGVYPTGPPGAGGMAAHRRKDQREKRSWARGWRQVSRRDLKPVGETDNRQLHGIISDVRRHKDFSLQNSWHSFSATAVNCKMKKKRVEEECEEQGSTVSRISREAKRRGGNPNIYPQFFRTNSCRGEKNHLRLDANLPPGDSAQSWSHERLEVSAALFPRLLLSPNTIFGLLNLRSNM